MPSTTASRPATPRPRWAKAAPIPAPVASDGAKMPPGAPEAAAARLATNFQTAKPRPRPGWSCSSDLASS